ncbi:hypothetical protein [Affinibrenneria salicis]|nr:hypothetical protein [Affinibrenneria salicis]
MMKTIIKYRATLIIAVTLAAMLYLFFSNRDLSLSTQLRNFLRALLRALI